MKKFRIFGVALFALFAVCALDVVIASPAMAEEICVELLAETSLWMLRTGGVCEENLEPLVDGLFELVAFLLALWLLNGVEVTTELPIEAMSGAEELLLEDTKTPVGAIAVKCSGSLMGWVGPNSLDWISEVLTLAGGSVKELVAAEAVTCAQETGSCPTPLVWAVNLGWETEVELWETKTALFGGLLSGFAILILPHAGGGNPGWEVECMGIIPLVDTCTGTEGAAELSLEGTTLLANFKEEFTELMGVKLATCTQSGEESGIVEGGGSVTHTGGGELTASSETAVS